MKKILFIPALLIGILAGCSSDNVVIEEQETVFNTANRFSQCTNTAGISETVALVPFTDKHLLFQWNNSVIHNPSDTYTSYIEVKDGVCRGTFNYTYPINFFGTSSYYLSPKFTDFCFEWRIVINGASGCHTETEWHYFTYGI